MVDIDNLIINIVDDNLAEEGAGKAIAFSILAFLLGSAGIVEGAEFNKNMEKLVKDKQVQQGGKVTITKGELKGVIEKSRKKEEMIGKWDLNKAKNLLARTLYMEAREDGIDGLNLVMSVIWNRAGNGIKEQFVPECLRPSQFSCWNNRPDSEKNPTSYQIQFPKCVDTGKGQDFKMWNKCVELANQAYAGTFKPVNANWNAYYNPSKCSPSWAPKLMGKSTVGHHVVGELKDQTQHAKNLKKKQQQVQKVQIAQNVKTREYIVKPGESLFSIAGKNMAKVEQIKKLNGLKSNTIHPGQVLKII